MMPNIEKLREMFPNNDEMLLRELMTECRDLQSLMDRLENQDASAVWKSNDSSSKKPEKKSKPNGNKYPRQPRQENKNPPAKPKEQQGALLSRKPKVQEFAQATNTTWDQIKVVDGEIAPIKEPEPQEQPNPNPQTTEAIYTKTNDTTETTTPNMPTINNTQIDNQPQQSKRQQKGKAHRKNPQATPVEQPPAEQKPQEEPKIEQPVEIQSATEPEQKTVELPKQEQKTEKPKEKPVLPKLALFLPSSLSSITPDYMKFGIFAGPIEYDQEIVQEKEAPAPSQRPTVSISNDFHHFEVPLVQTQVPLTQTQVFSTQIQPPQQPKEEVPQQEQHQQPYDQASIQNAPYPPSPIPAQQVIQVPPQGYNQPSFYYPYPIIQPPLNTSADYNNAAIAQPPAYVYPPYGVPIYTQFQIPPGTIQPVAPPQAGQTQQQQPQQNNGQFNVQQQSQRQMPMKTNYNQMQYPNSNNNNRRIENNNRVYQPPYLPK